MIDINSTMSMAARMYRRWAYTSAYANTIDVYAGTTADGRDRRQDWMKAVSFCGVDLPIEWARIQLYQSARGRRDAARAYKNIRHLLTRDEWDRLGREICARLKRRAERK